MAIQILLLAAVFLSALVGRGWTGDYAIAAYAIGGTLLTLGLALLVVAAVQLRTSLTPFPSPKEGQQLTTTGVFALVRHPMYGGGILIALGWTMIFASVVGLGVTLLLAIFADLKARREEVWLSESFVGYEAYRGRTPRSLVPFVY